MAAVTSFEDIVGNPATFLDRIFAGLAAVGINVDSYILDHVCYRVATEEEYEPAKRNFEALGSRLLVENIISGRMIATYKLPKPYIYNGRAIDVIELPSPKKGSPYETGLEHCEFVIDQTLQAFVDRYPAIQWDLSAMNKTRNADVRVGFENNKISVKFHCQPLEKVIEDELAEEKKH